MRGNLNGNISFTSRKKENRLKYQECLSDPERESFDDKKCQPHKMYTVVTTGGGGGGGGGRDKRLVTQRPPSEDLRWMSGAMELTLHKGQDLITQDCPCLTSRRQSRHNRKTEKERKILDIYRGTSDCRRSLQRRKNACNHVGEFCLFCKTLFNKLHNHELQQQ